MSKKNPAEKEYKYVCFEACLIPLVDKQLSDIFNYAIVKFSKEIPLSNNEIIDVTIRLYYDEKLPYSISSILSRAFEGEVEESMRGNDSSGEFDPENERDAISNWFESDDESDNVVSVNLLDFTNNCKPYCQLNRGLYSLNLTNGDYGYMIKSYDKITKIVSSNEFYYGKNPLVMAKTEMLLSFCNQDKSHRDFELFKAFLAIKSIQGQKEFTVASKAAVIARMIGAKSIDVYLQMVGVKLTGDNKKDLKESERLIKSKLLKDKDLLKKLIDYRGRYFYDLLLVELQLKSFITGKITYGRQTYLSTQLSNELLCIALMNFTEKKVLNNAAKIQKEEEKALRLRIANNLKNKQVH